MRVSSEYEGEILIQARTGARGLPFLALALFGLWATLHQFQNLFSRGEPIGWPVVLILWTTFSPTFLGLLALGFQPFDTCRLNLDAGYLSISRNRWRRLAGQEERIAAGDLREIGILPLRPEGEEGGFQIQLCLKNGRILSLASPGEADPRGCERAAYIIQQWLRGQAGPD